MLNHHPEPVFMQRQVCTERIAPFAGDIFHHTKLAPLRRPDCKSKIVVFYHLWKMQTQLCGDLLNTGGNRKPVYDRCKRIDIADITGESDPLLAPFEHMRKRFGKI